ncbi:MAG: hypothetical protein ACOYEC_02650, partial [Christensenellales bacterium]
TDGFFGLAKETASILKNIHNKNSLYLEFTMRLSKSSRNRWIFWFCEENRFPIALLHRGSVFKAKAGKTLFLRI